MRRTRRFWENHARRSKCQPLEIVLPQPDAAAAITHTRNAFEQKRAVETELWRTDARGRRRLLRVIMIPTALEDGVSFLSCAADDITEKWEYEQELIRCRESVDEQAAQKVGESADAIWGAVSSLVHLAETQDEGALSAPQAALGILPRGGERALVQQRLQSESDV